MLERGEQAGAEQRRGDIDLPPHQEVGLAGQHVADNAAERRRQNTHDHGRKRMDVQAERLGRADHRIGGQAERVEP